MTYTVPASSTKPITLSRRKSDCVNVIYSWHVPINFNFLQPYHLDACKKCVRLFVLGFFPEIEVQIMAPLFPDSHHSLPLLKWKAFSLPGDRICKSSPWWPISSESSLRSMFPLGFWKISSPSAQKTMKTREDAVPALSFFDTTHFCGMQITRAFPLCSQPGDGLLL